MRRSRHQHGFTLLLVIAMLPLLGMAAVVLTSNSRQIITQTRRHAVAVHAQCACESGIAWLRTNSPDTVTMDQPLVLTLDHKDKTITCRIECISQSNEKSIFKITGRAVDKRFSNEYSQQYIMKH